MTLDGDSNRGKSMGQIEACSRSALPISTETPVLDEGAPMVMSCQTFSIKKRAQGTERDAKASRDRAVALVFGSMTICNVYEGPSTIDVVPTIAGNSEALSDTMIPLEGPFQTSESLQSYFLLNELPAPRWGMPIIDTTDLCGSLAQFVSAFSNRTRHLVRTATPHVLMDQVARVL